MSEVSEDFIILVKITNLLYSVVWQYHINYVLPYCHCLIPLSSLSKYIITACVCQVLVSVQPFSPGWPWYLAPIWPLAAMFPHISSPTLWYHYLSLPFHCIPGPKFPPPNIWFIIPRQTLINLPSVITRLLYLSTVNLISTMYFNLLFLL